jgi:predicted lipoprotein with Yx(FWY)xxD motif
MQRAKYAVFFVFLIIVSACGGGSDDVTTTTAAAVTTTDSTVTTAPATTAPATTAEGAGTTTSAASEGATVQISTSDLGDILTDAEGMTLYLFMPDEQGEPTCNDDCAATWPPLTATVSAGDGVDEALLGSATRTDGSVQVTYNGWPLYYFIGDESAGDTNGQGLNDIWWVLDAAGEAVGS